MKRITLGNIRHALETMTHEVTVPADIAAPAQPCQSSACSNWAERR